MIYTKKDLRLISKSKKCLFQLMERHPFLKHDITSILSEFEYLQDMVAEMVEDKVNGTDKEWPPIPRES